MFTKSFSVVLLMSICVGAAAQETPEFPSPEPEHQWLQKFVGNWSLTSKAKMGPDQPDVECSGRMQCQMLGEFWLINKMDSEMMDSTMKGVQSIGYDPVKEKYIGTWVDSMTSTLWVYEGTVNEAGTKLTLEADGPNFTTPGKTAKFRDAYEFRSPDHLVVTSSMQGDDGEWITFMSGDAKRIRDRE
ncbi:hypothetical protein KOR42_36760 [Thalassoglobus neptunius]|uniref:DUF1579 domain-containing protein n=1 Tax=Thalassoglobus neptunius TaxID=1938619 RepID=A0A5C5WJH0_9PLAN|nr:DUF1579 domain-containing protein [Thalassoglobus neptunius]TWT49992.1 hypothetical protein KOR42_36760 [Thalassoglobus neptunius]